MLTFLAGKEQNLKHDTAEPSNEGTGAEHSYHVTVECSSTTKGDW